MRLHAIGKTVAVTAAAVLLAGLAGSGTAHADPWDRCPEGAVCIYPEGKDPAQDPNVNPTYVFYSYGAHNIQNQFNRHWVYNNQHSNASAQLCRGANGVGCEDPIEAKWAVYADLTPINSVKLNRP
jgi:hypothetical protein